jgi:hypothetical protein
MVGTRIRHTVNCDSGNGEGFVGACEMHKLVPNILQRYESLPSTFTKREFLSEYEKWPISDLSVETALSAGEIGRNLFGSVRIGRLADENSEVHIEENLHTLHRENDAKCSILAKR